MTEKHTPVPWTYRFRSQGTTIEPLNGAKILAVVWSTRGLGDVDANVRFIVQACNAHDELVAACKYAHKRLDHEQGCENGYISGLLPCTCGYGKIEAAIAKASPQAPPPAEAGAPGPGPGGGG